MSLHELDLAGRISDKIACVRGDRVDRFGTPEEIFTEGYIPKLYQMTTGSYDELTVIWSFRRYRANQKCLF